MEFKADINEHMMKQIKDAIDWQERRKQMEKIKAKIKQEKEHQKQHGDTYNSPTSNRD